MQIARLLRTLEEAEGLHIAVLVRDLDLKAPRAYPMHVHPKVTLYLAQRSVGDRHALPWSEHEDRCAA